MKYKIFYQCTGAFAYTHMSKHLFFLLFFFFSLHGGNPNFHICTFANYKHPNLEKLLWTCQKYGIELEILGQNQPWLGNGTKYIHLSEYLNTLPETDIVLFVDAFDVIFIADKATILNKFLKMNVPFLMGVEKNPFPRHLYGDQLPDGPTPFKYINTGSYIGYVGFLKKWFQDLAPIRPDLCDQLQTTLHYLRDEKAKEFYHFDYNCEIFLNLYGVKEKELIIDPFSGKFFLVTTRSQPCVLHANGLSFKIWNKVYDFLVATD